MNAKQKEWRMRERKRIAITYAIRLDRYLRLTELWKNYYADIPMSIDGIAIILRKIRTINDELSKFVPSAPQSKDLRNKYEHYYYADLLLNAILKNRVYQNMNTAVSIETHIREVY